MDDWISRQLQSDQHKVVENDAEITDYPINSYVLYTPPMGRINELLPKHKGPYQVRGQKQSIYIIEDLVLGKQIKTHVHNLRPFIFSPTRVNPIDIAQQNEQEFMVRDIIAHRGDHHRRSSMEFLVRCNSWEPYKVLMHENLFQDFPRLFQPRLVFPLRFLVSETSHTSVY